jgi:hypothetical protein
VSFVEQPIKLFAVPTQAEFDRGAERGGSPLQLSDLDVLDPPAIDPGDERA